MPCYVLILNAVPFCYAQAPPKRRNSKTLAVPAGCAHLYVVLQLGVQGILVLDARKGGPAWKSGMKGTSRDKYGRLVLGDIITAMNGKKVRTASDLYKLLDKCNIGDEIDMEVGL